MTEEYSTSEAQSGNLDRPGLRTLFALSSALAIGVYLRFHHLGQESVFLDEAWLAAWSKLPLTDILTGRANVPEFAFTLILKFIGRTFGYSPMTIRLVPAIAGSLLILSSFCLATRLMSRTASVFVALLISLSPIAVSYSKDASNYSLMMLFSSMYLMFFLDYIKDQRLSSLLLFAFTALFVNYLHVYNMFILSALLVYSYFRLSGRSKRIVFCTVPCILFLSIPAAYAIINVFLNFRLGPAIDRPSIPLHEVYDFARKIVFMWLNGPSGSRYLPPLPKSFLTNAGSAVFFWMVFIFGIGRNLFKRDEKTDLLLLALSIYGVSVFFAAVISGFYFERYFLVLAPIFYILLARALLCGWSSRRAGYMLQAVLICILFHFASVDIYNHGKRPFWKGTWDQATAFLRGELLSDAAAGEDRKSAIFIPVNYETVIVQFYLPEYRRAILWDDAYQSFIRDPRMVRLGFDDMRRFNVDLLKRAASEGYSRLYVITERGRAHLDYVAKHLEALFVLSKEFGADSNVVLRIYQRRPVTAVRH